MSILERIKEPYEWEQYYQYKEESANMSKEQLKDLETFIKCREYEPVLKSISDGASFETPHKICLNKMYSDKKRTVYTYSREENYVLKLIAYLLKEYDDVFADNLYSFRKRKGVRNAVEDILCISNLGEMYTYKVDISNYFNSIDVERMILILQETLEEDRRLFEFIKSLLTNPYVYEDGKLTTEEKGIMAGTPISPFLANLYLKDLDQWFLVNHRSYARYSDDIIVFSPAKEELEENAAVIMQYLNNAGLSINAKKEFRTMPHEKWNFLGFSYENGVIDVSDISIEKLKKKMRRKVRALLRWQRKNHVSGEKTALAFIRHFNRKFFENKRNHELTWTRWYFPVINTTEGLKKIDHFMQEQIRFLATGKRTKSRYQMRYEEMKKLGYLSLVHEYYKKTTIY